MEIKKELAEAKVPIRSGDLALTDFNNIDADENNTIFNVGSLSISLFILLILSVVVIISPPKIPQIGTQNTVIYDKL